MERIRQNPEWLLQVMNKEEERKNRGHLKIFFGYAAGVGKTYAMLEAAHAAKQRGIDVVAGYVEPHERPETTALLYGLEQLPKYWIDYNGITLKEFDMDAAIERHPGLILVDELAHTNAEQCRHAKRYQDVEELLKQGIDVYTTVNVQHIESLNDIVAAITGIMVRERIPDSVFDHASQVELVDIEPQELLERIQDGKVYMEKQAKKATEHFFTVENLTALREIALRRSADRVNVLLEDVRMKNGGEYHTDEHILVCLSAAPSNKKIIRTAARMTKAFHSSFTALYVQTSDFSVMEEEDQKRLQENMRLAQRLGAKIETVYGEDVPFQIAEFARLSGVSKIVIGRSNAARKFFFDKPALTERLIANAPNLDIHIIPDSTQETLYRNKKKRKNPRELFNLGDMIKSLLMLFLATGLGFIFYGLGFSESNIIMIYILSVLLTSVITTQQFYSLASSIISVIVFNFFFTEPRYTFLAYEKEYPITFLVMFLAAFITGSLAVRLKKQAQQSARAAYRTKVLFDTSQLLEQVKNRNEIVTATASQLIKLLNRNLIIYLSEEGELGKPQIFSIEENTGIEEYSTENERAVASWVLKNNKHAGATTETLSNAKCLYLSIRMNENVYGVVGIVVGEKALDAFENSILLSILGECALALENEKNRQEKEEAAVLAQKEQLRANLLRSISHDLRTPLTSISGNASNLLSNSEKFDEETRKHLYLDIYDDSMWLINLVENLLSVTRIEEGRMNLHISMELMDEVITEALRHVNRMSSQHIIRVKSTEEFILARIDAKLIVQVIINMVDNAIKYTPEGSEIEIFTEKVKDKVVVCISDNGPGISDEIKQHVFDMFYSGANQVADSRRSLGLGLSLCKSIIHAHGGTLEVMNNVPQGTIFKFTLPAGEVNLYE